MHFSDVIRSEYNRELASLSDQEIYLALVKYVKALAEEKRKREPSQKKLYYLSAEFLIGKLLPNDLINLGVYDEVRSYLAENQKSLEKIEDIETEPALGNGGLGRLAACFLDSIATLGLNGDGVGLKYHFGLFRQVFKNNEQTAACDAWLTEDCRLIPTNTVYTVRFESCTVTARMYDLLITGYQGVTNTLHLFDIESVDETIVKEGIRFDKGDIEKNLTLFLYPDDSDEKGRLLRICQQYCLVSCAARLILDEATAKGCRLHDLADYAVIQINDTHPTMIIPELVRLMTEKGLETDAAIEAVRKACAYTNHTILAEALETWPLDYLKKTVPQLVGIIEILDNKVRRQYDDPSVWIIDNNNLVHMAHIDIHYSKSVNGVASLHTEILKKEELSHFYRIYPEKFNNKTNGITFRRWLMHANPELCQWIEGKIGDSFQKRASDLKHLLAFQNDKTALAELEEIKRAKKEVLADFIFRTKKIALDKNSIFDIQVKRLHEYKRQQLNALYVITKYLAIKNGKLPTTPITVIFGAKAAPAYTIAQDIIHLILCLEELIGKDPEVSRYLKVVMVENYNVTAAEKLIPAADLSQQISLASKEASGTGNMKFMLNGAITIGTLDGANVEIHELVGNDNIFIFGDESAAVVERYKKGSYDPENYYRKNKTIRQALDFITDESMLKIGNPQRLLRLAHELRTRDYFMTFPDFDDYVKTREKAYAAYEDRSEWTKKMLVNIAMAGYFSSDRTVAEYNRDIWKL